MPRTQFRSLGTLWSPACILDQPLPCIMRIKSCPPLVLFDPRTPLLRQVVRASGSALLLHLVRSTDPPAAHLAPEDPMGGALACLRLGAVPPGMVQPPPVTAACMQYDKIESLCIAASTRPTSTDTGLLSGPSLRGPAPSDRRTPLRDTPLQIDRHNKPSRAPHCSSPQTLITHFPRDISPGVKTDWVESQAIGTLNWSCPPWLDWFHGGLHFQIEHHLFPRFAHTVIMYLTGRW